MINRLLLYSMLVFLLFSCTSSDVQENNIIDDVTNNVIETSNNKKVAEKIIAIYSKENQLEIWDNNAGESVIKKTIDISEADLPLGIQKIKSIDNNKISFHYSKSSKYPIDSIIHMKETLEDIDNINNYTLIIVPSRPKEYGAFEGCLQCPHWTREMALQSKLEWESIFGNFQNIH